MRRAIVRLALTGSVALILGGCAADSYAALPEFMRVKAAEPPPPEPPPDVKQLVRNKLDAVFLASSHPRQVRVSLPHREVHGNGWTACVRADVDSATGKPLGPQTYRITILDGMIVDRLRAGDDDNCDPETYEPI